METPDAPEANKWEEVSGEVLDAIALKMEPRVRRASEALYDDLLSTVQDYLCENVQFNIGERLASAERERRHQWNRAEAAKAANEQLYNALLAARKALFVAVQGNVEIEGFDPAEHVVIKQIDAALAQALAVPA